jgi:hypothetical protein
MDGFLVIFDIRPPFLFIHATRECSRSRRCRVLRWHHLSPGWLVHKSRRRGGRRDEREAMAWAAVTAAASGRAGDSGCQEWVSEVDQKEPDIDHR